MSAVEKITEILREVEDDAPEVEGTALVSWEGLLIAGALRSDFDETMVSATASTLQGLGEQTATEFTKGKLDFVTVTGTGGYVFVTSVKDTGVLIVITNKRAKIGVVLFAMNKAKKKLAKLF